MANLFGLRSVNPISPRDRLLRQYKTAQVNLYIVAAFTIVNVITAALFISDSYFLFSAFIPYEMVISALIFCGKLPPEFYTEMEMEGMTFLPEGIFIGATILALVIAGLYLLFGLFSKKKVGWMLAALVLYAIDTFWILFNYGIDISFALDYLFHLWVIVSLSMGIAASYRMKALPEEAPETASETEQAEGSALKTSPVIRGADLSQKAKILVQAEALGHKIYYRRVKQINELVVDDQVYAEIELLIQPAHFVEAMIDGHVIQAGYDGIAKCYIKIDGETVAKKTKLV